MRLAEVSRETSEPAMLVDDRGLVVHLNHAFTAAFGWTAGELVGRPLSRIVPPTLRDAHHLAFARFLATGAGTLVGHPIDLTVLTADGRERGARMVIVAEEHGERWRFGAILSPR